MRWKASTDQKAYLLIPVGFIGAMTPLAFSTRPRTTFDVLFPALILVPGHLGVVAFVAWLWRGRGEGRPLGHSRAIWTFLIAFAYLLGFGAMLFS